MLILYYLRFYNLHLIVFLGALVVLCLGKINHLSPAFHTRTQLYPEGYVSVRTFADILNPSKTASYICRVSSQLQQKPNQAVASYPELSSTKNSSFFTPRFEVIYLPRSHHMVECPDEPGRLFANVQNLNVNGHPRLRSDMYVFEGRSPEEAWEKVFHLLMKRGWNRNNCFQAPTGTHLFGLNLPYVVRLLEALPHACKCKLYSFLFAAPTASQHHVEFLPTNASGCACCEPICVLRKQRLHATLSIKTAMNTPVIERSEYQHQQMKGSRRSNSTVSHMQNNLSDAMQYRHCKERMQQTVRVGYSKIHGFGLYACRVIHPSEMIVEYVGEVIRPELTDKREHYYDSRNLGSYMFRIDEKQVVDATLKGGQARFVNHSCDPNCISRIVSTDKGKKIVIIAKRAITEGEELTYDYQVWYMYWITVGIYHTVPDYEFVCHRQTDFLIIL